MGGTVVQSLIGEVFAALELQTFVFGEGSSRLQQPSHAGWQKVWRQAMPLNFVLSTGQRRH